MKFPFAALVNVVLPLHMESVSINVSLSILENLLLLLSKQSFITVTQQHKLRIFIAYVFSHNWEGVFKKTCPQETPSLLYSLL